MIYVLIIIGYGWNSVDTQEFSSKDACMQAMQSVSQIESWGTDMHMVCVQK
jgi:hypothetical protein